MSQLLAPKTSFKRLSLFTFVILFLQLFIFNSSIAATKTWTGATSTDWNTASNWSPLGIPLAADVINIPGSLSRYPVINNSVTGTSIVINSSGSGASLSVTAGGTLALAAGITVNANGTYLQDGGTASITGFTNSGSATVSGGTIASDGNFTVSAATTFSQTGGVIHLAINTSTIPTASLVINTGGTYNQSGGTLSFRDYTTSPGTFNQTNTSALVKVYHDWRPGTGNVFNSTAGTIQFAGSPSNNGPDFSVGSFQFNNVVIDAGADPSFDNKAGSNISISGNYTNNSTSLSENTNITYTFNGIGTQTISSVSTGATFGNLVINKSSGSAVLTTNANVAGNTTMTSGTFDLSTFTANRTSSGGTMTISAGTTLRLAGTSGGLTGSNLPLNFTSGIISPTCTIEYYGGNSTTQTIYNGITYGNLVLTNNSGSGSATKNTTGSLTVSGTLTVNTGAVLTPGAAFTVGGTGTLTGSGTVQVTRTAATADFLSQYTISNRTLSSLTVEYTATAAQTINALNYYNLTVTGARGTSSITYASTGSIGVSGTFSPLATFTTGGRIVTGSTFIFNGSVAQTIPAFTFNNLTISNAANITLSGNITVGGALSFTTGKIITSTYSVISTGTVSGASQATGWVNGNLQKSFSFSALSKVFEVGGTVNYNPMTLTFASVITGGAITVNGAGSVHPNLSGAGFGSNISRYWTLTNTGLVTFTTYSVSLNWNASQNFTNLDSTYLSVAKYGTLVWSFPTIAGTTTSTSIQASGMTTFGDFVVGQVCNATSGFSYSASSFCTSVSSASATLNIGATAGTFSASPAGLSINSSTGTIDIPSSTPGTYTITNTVVRGACTSTSTTNITIITLQWTGTVSTDWNTSGNWSCGSVPASTADVIIPSGLTNYPIITTSEVRTVNNLTIQTGATINVDGGTLKIGGLITNSGSIKASNGSIEFNGTTAQTIPANTFTTNTVLDLTINNTSGVTLGGVLNLTDILEIKAGSLTTGGYLTLKSSSDNTARVAAITSASATPIVGNVTVERYIAGRRKYRLITSSVTTSTSSTLSAGQEAQSIWGNWQNAGVGTTQNIGTSITGGTAADGFDQITANPSMFYYNTTTKGFVAFSSANGKNTKYTPLKAGVAYYMFVFGDRQNSAAATSPRNTILKSTGTLVTGSVLLNSSSSLPLSNVIGNYTLVGNPYACPIDWKNVTKSGINSTIWGWDANLSSIGGFVTVNLASGIPLISPISALVKVNQYIQPGQGFFVQATTTNPQILFSESNKLSSKVNINSNLFRTANDPQPLMAINLIYDNAGTKTLADGAVAYFDNNFSNNVSEEDGLKMLPSTEGLGIANGGKVLSIDARQQPITNDTIQLNLTNLKKMSYTLEVFGQALSFGNMTPYLEDTYLKTVQALSAVDTNRIVFTVNTDATSFDVNRFKIVFREQSSLPVTFTATNATLKEKNVQVDWNVVNEDGIKSYEVEHSANGNVFLKVAQVDAKGSRNNAYNWVDVNAAPGTNFYRIKAVQRDGKYFYSKTVLMNISAANSGVRVFPNPITDQQVSLQFNSVEKGQYNLVIHNAKGQEVASQVIEHPGGSSSKVIYLNTALPKGMYFVEITNGITYYHQTILSN